MKHILLYKEVEFNKLPIQFIDLYNGSEVFLNISTDELPKYKIL